MGLEKRIAKLRTQMKQLQVIKTQLNEAEKETSLVFTLYVLL